MHPSELWESDRFSARLIRTGLTPLSWLYAGGWRLYAALYRVGLKRPQEPHRPVVCVGNLTAGGSGKSPIALWLAEQIPDSVIACSGYGSPASEGATLAPPGPLEAARWGDEAAMMRWLHPEIPLIVGRNRVRAAALCQAHFPSATLILDDGLQHLPLKKHLTIVLEKDRRNRRCLPAGPYREPFSGRHHADFLFWKEPFRVVSSLAGFLTPSGEQVVPEPGQRVSALCALGEPQGFLDALREVGLVLDQVELRPDHDPLAGNLWSRFDPALPVVVTAKDWVKLRVREIPAERRIWIALQRVHVEPEARWREALRQKLDEIATQTT